MLADGANQGIDQRVAHGLWDRVDAPLLGGLVGMSSKATTRRSPVKPLEIRGSSADERCAVRTESGVDPSSWRSKHGSSTSSSPARFLR